MIEILTLLAIIILLGALAGGDSFGEIIRTGCGCLTLLILLGLAGIFFLLIPL